MNILEHLKKVENFHPMFESSENKRWSRIIERGKRKVEMRKVIFFPLFGAGGKGKKHLSYFHIIFTPNKTTGEKL